MISSTKPETSAAGEVWKDIPGYEGRYQASSLGRIRSVDMTVKSVHKRTGTPYTRNIKGRIKTQTVANMGYLVVNLGHQNVRLVHELVALTFYGPRPSGHEICHGDGNPKNNRADNLRYDTRRENGRDKLRYGGTMKKLRSEDVRKIRALAKDGVKRADIAEAFNISLTMVGLILSGRAHGWIT